MKSSSFETTSSTGGGSSGTGTGSRSGSGSFNLRNLSKVILPPLGGPSAGQSQSHGGSNKWVISPHDSRYRWWDTLMVVLVAYSAWVYPFEVAFMNASPKGGLEVADIVVDLFFAVDIVLTFFVAYIDHRTQLLVRDRRKITLSLPAPSPRAKAGVPSLPDPAQPLPPPQSTSPAPAFLPASSTR